MRVLTTFVVIVILATLALFASASNHPSHLLRSLYKEQGKSFDREIGPNRWNFLNPTLLGGVNGGGGCAGCTLVVGLFEQVLQLNNGNSASVSAALCTPMKNDLERGICNDVLNALLPVIQTYRNEGLTADAACHALNSCKTEAGQPTCHLFPTKPNAKRLHELVASTDGRAFRQRHAHTLFTERAMELLGAPDWICKILPEICQVADHLPAFDSDNDTFSYSEKTLRGTYWRGKDLDDLDQTIHPGRASSDALFDENCNGISGVDESGAPYEDKFCKGTGEMGIAILGDSATAHFSLPPSMLNASDFSYGTYKDIISNVEDELDWPQISWSTGHLNNSQFYPNYWQNIEPTHSVYKFLKQTNLCNNNDYQNLGVNGARASNLLSFAQLLGRVNNVHGGGVQHKPLMLFMAMIGNDVCNSKCDVSSMTTTEQYYQHFLDAVIYADGVLAPGSVQVLVGLADGRVLYDYMHARIHPIGSVNQDVTYTDLYDFLNCLQISPCCTWMNSNETIRNRGSAHAANLSAQLPRVQAAVQGKLKNSKVFVVNNWIEALKQETKYPKYDLIEKSDGFHPSAAGNSLLAQYMLNQSIMQGFWPKPNPHNDAIRQQFPNIMNEVLN